MKNKIIIATAVATATALIITLVKRRKSNKRVSEIPVPHRSHHLTDVFAHAKNPIT